MHWSDDSEDWLVERAAARLLRRLLVAEEEENAECLRAREQRSPQQRARVGRGSEQVAAARKQRGKKPEGEKAELLPPAGVACHN